MAVVNEAFVRTYSPDRDVFTTRLRRNVRDSPLLQIVGVVGDVRPSYANDTRPEMFFPVTQDPPLMMRLVMRSAHHQADEAEPSNVRDLRALA